VVIRADGFDQALAMVRAGLGVALLPAFVAHSCPDIEPLSAEVRALRTPRCGSSPAKTCATPCA
jgi:DNA-binding transcriptional LysR family regulator